MTLLACGGRVALAFHAYRELLVSSTSTVDPRQQDTIAARTQFTNRGAVSVQLTANLRAARQLKFPGATYSVKLQPGETAIWTWSFTAPAGFSREVLSGEIAIDGKTERDLLVAVQGGDPLTGGVPANLDKGLRKHIDPITERARVVATFSPRQRQSVVAQIAKTKAAQPMPALTLAEMGTTRYSVQVQVLPAPPTGQEALAYWAGLKTLTPPQRDLVAALSDLQRVFRIKTGAMLPIRTSGEGPAIRLRLTDLGTAAKGLQDAYRLHTEGADIVIDAQDLDGLRNGIYGLLTDHLDCHWFAPGELGEEVGIPPDRALRLAAISELRGSRWTSASGSIRNRAMVNRGRANFGHAWYSYVNAQEYPYEKFPEYYARDRSGKIRKRDTGETFTNFCSTNPDVIAIVARKVNAFFHKNPDAIIASLDPNDYAPMCLCDRCLALDKKYGQKKEDGTQVADRLLHFSKEIYDRLEPRFKNRYLGILVYGFQMDPPISAKGHPHHMGMICDMFWTYDHSRPWNDPTSPRNEVFRKQLKAWGGALSQLGYYEYTGNAEFFGPWGIVYKIREDLPAFRVLGGTFLSPEAQAFYATQGLNLYISDRLSWDIDADVDVLLEELFARFYGPAADPMRAYWMAIEREYSLARQGSRLERRLYSQPSDWDELKNHLQEAVKRTSNLPAEQKRFADRVQFTRDGLEYAMLTSEYQNRFEQKSVDHAAAIAFLKQHGTRMSEIAKKYASGNGYWPPLAPEWAIATYNSESLLIKHQKALTEVSKSK
jgi:hypothetical protein